MEEQFVFYSKSANAKPGDGVDAHKGKKIDVVRTRAMGCALECWHGEALPGQSIPKTLIGWKC